MLKKLLKNLPFNPSLIDHVPIYRKAILKERKVRLYALIIFVLAIGLELFIMWRPPQSTITSSPNISASQATLCNTTKQNVCVINTVTVRNATQSITDANATTAHKGDHLVYTLIARNYSKHPIKYSVSANFNSVLSYSYIYSSYGGVQKNGFISWTKQTISGSNLAVQQVEMVVDNPIPNTPESAVDPSYYNGKMLFSYGNSVSVSVPLTFSKFVEIKVNNLLPFMNIGVVLLAMAALMLFMLIFIVQCNLLLKELDCIKDEYLDKD